MSEYQYYQFQVLDRPLSERQQQELRAISTRAEITSTSFINTYNWGDLKAEPLNLMKKYFDAHVYVANWGTHCLMLKLPRDLFDVDLVKPYCTDYTLSVHTHRRDVIVCFQSNDDGGYYGDEWDSGEGWLASLLPIREDLMMGDYRSLYLGWLCGLYDGSDEPEPPLPPGMKQLSGHLKMLADFLYLDDCLLEAATAHDAGSPAPAPSQREISQWAARLPAPQKDELIAQLLTGEQHPSLLVSPLRRQFQKEWKEVHRASAAPALPPRTAGKIFEAAEVLAEKERRREEAREARERVEREQKEAAERKRFLAQLAPRQGKVWSDVESLLKTTNQQNYDEAVERLKDLRDLATTSSSGDVKSWERRIDEFRRAFFRKPALMRRFDKAGFP